MERKTITIEEIEANPNLDLTKRMNQLASDPRWSEEDLRELAIASIKNEYEYLANNMADNPHMDEILKQVLNGHVYSQEELASIWSADEISDIHGEKSTQIKKYNDLRERITNSSGITPEDFNGLCETIGFDDKTTELMKLAFEQKGLIIDEYKSNEESGMHM